jgi:hypothetical protein
LFRLLVEILQDTTQLDFMVALGTHPPLTQESLNRLVGITSEERKGIFRHVGLLNHAWDAPSALKLIGRIESDEIRQIAERTGIHPRRSGHSDQSPRPGIRSHPHPGPHLPHEVVGFQEARAPVPGISARK